MRRGAALSVRGCRGRVPVAGGLRSTAGELLVRGSRQLVALCLGAVLIALLASVPTAVSSGRRVSATMILIQPYQSLRGVPTTGIAPASKQRSLTEAPRALSSRSRAGTRSWGTNSTKGLSSGAGGLALAFGFGLALASPEGGLAPLPFEGGVEEELSAGSMLSGLALGVTGPGLWVGG